MHKTKYIGGIFASLLSLFAVVATSQQMQEQGNHQLITNSDNARLSGIFHSISDSEYEIRWQDKANGYQAPNRRQNFRFTFESNGFVATRRVKETPADNWSVGLHLRTIGSENGSAEFRQPDLPVLNKAQAVFRSPDVEFEYINGRDGMRQNFLVVREVKSEKLKLRIHATLVGTRMEINEQGDAVNFFADDHNVMTYDDLNVFDSTGSRLHASFEAENPNMFSIVVDLKDASFPILVDPLTHWVGTTGPQTNAKFGFSVAMANVSSQLMEDIIVGAPYYDGGSTDEGKVFVYHGSGSSGTAPDTTADWSEESDQAYAKFGFSVANAGDTDDDNYDEIIIGAPDYDNTSYSNDGNVWVYFGSSSGIQTTPWTSGGSNDNAEYGYSVAGAGDVNDDGYADIIIGAPSFNTGSITGKVFVYYGSSSGPTTSGSWTATVTQTSSDFGFSVASAGDTNDDGYADIIVGAPRYDNGQTNEGMAFLWLGGSSGLGSNGTYANADRKYEENQATANFGFSVSTALDVNSDYYDDIIIGAPRHDNGQTNEGRAYVYEGGTSGPDTTHDWKAESNQAYAQLGYSVSTAGDLESDSYADVVIGMPYYDYSVTNGGGILVFYGNSTDGGLGSDGSPSNADAGWYNLSYDANAGYSVSWSDNGFYHLHAAIVVGAPGDDSGDGAFNLWYFD